ncbi:claudin-4-like [Macrotis lagotis]|uniref:claudin-4-like n=1 Tax=Macrotis lagotis TaxID=92651 RepID=UPI003D694574
MKLNIRTFFILMTTIILALVGWLLCIFITNSVCWRLWQFSNQNVTTMWIGLWKACYLERKSPAEFEVVCDQLDSLWDELEEFHYFQDLIILSDFLQAYGLILNVGALLSLLKEENCPNFIHTCHLIAAFSYILDGICVGVAVIYNSYLDVSGQSTLPDNFPYHLEKIIEKTFGHGLFFGIASAVCSLVSGTVLSWHTCLSKSSRIQPKNSILTII